MRDAAIPPRTADERSSLCLACGLCCQGALHDLVPLEEDEVERAGRLRLPLFESPVMLAFRLPCPRLDDRRCTVYEERPRMCATYACGVLTAYTAREIDEATALQRVERAREQGVHLARATRHADETARRAALHELGWMRKTWFDP